MNRNNCTLDLGLDGALAGGVERCVVDEGQVGIATVGVLDLPESNL
jgi:hypothetical protein